MIRRLGLGALVGGLLMAALMGVAFLIYQLAGLSFFPYDLFNWVTRVLPGDLVTFGIDLMIDSMRALGLSVVDLAKTAERASATLQFLVIGIGLGAVFFALLGQRPSRSKQIAGISLGLIFGLVITAIQRFLNPSAPLSEAVWITAALLIWGVLLGGVASRLLPETAVTHVPEDDRRVENLDRRRFLVQLGASTAVITVSGAGLGAWVARAQQQQLTAGGESITGGAAGAASSLPNANDPVMPVPGTRPEYTPIVDHYKVFIETEPTIIEEADWTLPITGMVDNAKTYTLDDIRNNFESFSQYVTLTCISGRVGTGLISTTKWTGISAQDLLDDVGVQPEAKYLFITSGDGFYETVSIDEIRNDRRIMFCYAWDDQLLPKDHGFPLRIWLPDRYGMKQPKWITGIEVTDQYKEGYWVERNWDEEARIKATSVIDTVAVEETYEQDGQMFVPIGGIAFAGARGISRVQVRADGGEWQDAQLRSPLSETTWVIWRYEWPFQAGDHLFEVRTFEGDGTPQIAESSKARPSGSTGIHSVEATISA